MAESKKMMKREVAFMKAKGAPKGMLKHEQSEMKGMAKGKGKGMAKGGMYRSTADGPAVRKGKTKGMQVKMAKGGMTKGC
jgi:hypothetical protein